MIRLCELIQRFLKFIQRRKFFIGNPSYLYKNQKLPSKIQHSLSKFKRWPGRQVSPGLEDIEIEGVDICFLPLFCALKEGFRFSLHRKMTQAELISAVQLGKRSLFRGCHVPCSISTLHQSSLPRAGQHIPPVHCQVQDP